MSWPVLVCAAGHKPGVDWSSQLLGVLLFDDDASLPLKRDKNKTARLHHTEHAEQNKRAKIASNAHLT